MRLKLALSVEEMDNPQPSFCIRRRFRDYNRMGSSLPKG